MGPGPGPWAQDRAHGPRARAHGPRTGPMGPGPGPLGPGPGPWAQDRAKGRGPCPTSPTNITKKCQMRFTFRVPFSTVLLGFVSRLMSENGILQNVRDKV